MDRRELLKAGAAIVAATTLARCSLQRSIPVPALVPTTRKLRMDTYSRTLHWLRTPQDVAAAVREIGNTSVDLTIRAGGGHVDPEKVKTDLPVFVKGLRDGGVDVSMIAPTITDATDANAEAVLDTASQLGIHHYWWGTYRFDETKPYWPQLDALKPKVEAIAKLNEKYGMKGMAHPRDGAGSVSAAFFDLLYVLQNFDPRYVSFQYDTHHLLQAFDSGWVQQLRMGAPYIGGFVWKDIAIERADTPNPDDAVRAAAAAAAPAGGAAAGGGRGGRGAAGAAPAGGPGGAAGAAGAGRGGGGRGGAAANATPTKTRIRQVPVGTGNINLPLIAATLKEIGFDGPMECEPEWPGLGGAENGATTLTKPRAEVIALLKRDRDYMDGILTTAGLM